MTLSIDSSSIKVKNNLGVVKFNSNDKLVYLKAMDVQSISLYNATVIMPFTAMGNNDFLYLTIRFDSSDGNSLTSLLGKFIPANGSIVTNFYGRGVNNTPSADTDLLSVTIVGSDLHFKSWKKDYLSIITGSTITSNITYNARIYSYL